MMHQASALSPLLFIVENIQQFGVEEATIDWGFMEADVCL